jgi:hypothetical protein
MSIFKDSFTPAVRGQLTARGNAFLKRTSNDIIYINGRTAWVRMVSGVDVGGDSTLAKENISFSSDSSLPTYRISLSSSSLSSSSFSSSS